MNRAYLLTAMAMGAACAGPSSPPPVPPVSAASLASTPPPVPVASASSAGGFASPEGGTAEAIASSAPPPASEPTLPAAASAGSPRACPEGETWIPPTGPQGYSMGKGARWEHRVVLTNGFCIDASETTVRDYAMCVAAGACKEPWRGDPFSTYPLKVDEPVNLVSWTKAHAYCSWAGKRLPTEAEWEWTATGPDQTKYPWGDEPEPSCDYVDYTKYGAPKWAAGADVGCGGGGPSPVGSHPKGDKTWPDGAVHDLAGNVWEWVEDSFAPLSAEPQTDPVVRTQTGVHTIRGGGWNRSYAAMAVTYRGAAHYSYQVPALGFRCVRGKPLPTPSPVYP